MKRSFVLVPLFGLFEAALATREWLRDPDLWVLGKLAFTALLIAPCCIYLAGRDFWLLWYIGFGMFAASILGQNSKASVSATWAPVLAVVVSSSIALVGFLAFREPEALLNTFAWIWGTMLAVVAFRYSTGLAGGCSTLFSATIAWWFLQFVVQFLRNLSFGITAWVLSLFLPELPSWIGPTVELLTQWSFDIAALGVVWLGAAMAQEDAMEGHPADAGHYLGMVRQRMMEKQ